MTDEQLDELNEKISTLFEGMSLEDVAAVLKIQLAMLVTQGADNAEEAGDFLADITEEVEEMISSFDYEQTPEA